MVLEKYISNGEVDKIKELISKMEVIGCGETFSAYMSKCNDSCDLLSYLETKFYEKLKGYLPDIIVQFSLEASENHTEYAKELLLHGTYSLYEQDMFNLLESIDCTTDHNAIYPILIEFMNKSIDEVVEEELRTKDQKIKDILDSEIEVLNNTIKRNAEVIERAKVRLEELTKQSNARLEELTKQANA